MMINKQSLTAPAKAKATLPDNAAVAPFIIDLAMEQEMSAMLRKQSGKKLILSRSALTLGLLAGAIGLAMASRQSEPQTAPPHVVLPQSQSTGLAFGHRDASIPVRSASLFDMPSLLSSRFEELAPKNAETASSKVELNANPVAAAPQPVQFEPFANNLTFGDSLELLGAVGTYVLAQIRPIGPLTGVSSNAALQAEAPVIAQKGKPTQDIGAPPVEAEPPAMGLSPEEIQKLLGFADDALAAGDITTARLFLMKAARTGNGRAFVALAETYDQKVLDERGVIGVTGDAAKAKEYYEQAKAAGEAGAVQALARLDAKK
jgi:hypothetical protein